MKASGLAIVPISRSEQRTSMEEKMSRAASLVAPGRILVAYWEVPHEWSGQVPIEAWVTAAVLSSPEKRQESEQDEFAFFANLVTRTYADDPAVPARTFHVLLFRRCGELPYRRRHDPGVPLQIDALDTAAFAFTRDVANNTWHIRDEDAEDEIVARLSRLLCWSDEKIIEIGEGVREISTIRGRESLNLIGMALKTRYEWQPGSTRIRQMSLLRD